MTAPLPDGLHDVPAGKLAAVVTSLAMDRRPAPREAGLRADLALRREGRPRPDWYRALFRRIGAPWLWTSRLTLSDDALTAIIADPAVAVFTVEHGGADIGLLELDFRVAGACEIAFFGIMPDQTGRGIGRWLMDRALEHAWSQPIARLWVHTCSLDDPRALAFYRRSGFVPFRRQVEIMDDPRRIGLLPADAAPDVPCL